MIALSILAATTSNVHEYLVSPSYLPRLGDLRNWVQNMDPVAACVLILGGFLYLFKGFKMHRVLLAVTAAIIGGYLGAGLGQRYGLFWAAIVSGVVLMGIASWYFTAFAASIQSAIIGALLGASIWETANLEPQYAWAGALIGAVTLGLLSFIIFRASVIVFSTVQGAVMFVVGIMGMAYYYTALRPAIGNIMGRWPYAWSATIVALILCGLAYQYMTTSGGKSGASAGATGADKAAAKPEKAKA